MIDRIDDDDWIDTVILGDSLDVLKQLPDNSVDALVSDPPAGISFMNREFDSARGGREHWIAWLASIMREALRTMKPGAHGLVWALPRTSHWTATALEDAGFEVRDVLYHLYSSDTKVAAFMETLSPEQYNLFASIMDSQDEASSKVLACFGSGFPKSLSIDKAIDKHFKAEREVIGRDPYYCAGRKHTFGDGNKYGTATGGDEETAWVTAPATPLARQFSGYGTALKPAVEEWILVRKPISEKNIATNVIRWGVGGLNIDKSRIGYINEYDAKPKDYSKSKGIGTLQESCKEQGARPYVDGFSYLKNDFVASTPTNGRFPSHLLLSHSLFCTDDSCSEDCPIAEVDRQSGNRPNGYRANPSTNDSWFGTKGHVEGERGYKDQGGASRYFKQFRPADDVPFIYTAKASRKDRSSNGVVENTHPTTKSIKLMEYLISLVCPAGGIVLDPFLGSGSTAVAAINTDHHFIGIEKEPEYYEICQARIAHALKGQS
jgi:DNA modification methylase